MRVRFTTGPSLCTHRAPLPSEPVEAFRVVGGARLEGAVRVPGAKNSVLKLMAAALLTEGTSTLMDVPDILDVRIMAELLRRLGCAVDHDPAGGVVSVALPGGDAIGSRGLDMHVTGMQQLGAVVHVDHGFLVAEAPEGLRGAHVRLEFPSVGATEDLCRMLRRMGARIEGVATSTLTVEGVEKLHPVEHRVVPDRIVAGTWAFAAALTGGDVVVRTREPGHLRMAPHKPP